MLEWDKAREYVERSRLLTWEMCSRRATGAGEALRYALLPNAQGNQLFGPEGKKSRDSYLSPKKMALAKCRICDDSTSSGLCFHASLTVSTAAGESLEDRGRSKSLHPMGCRLTSLCHYKRTGKKATPFNDWRLTMSTVVSILGSSSQLSCLRN